MNNTNKIEKKYSLEEKNSIFNRLNEERVRKRNEKIVQNTSSKYDQKEKSNIFEKLNDRRREKQSKTKLLENKYGNKKVHILENRECYKILGLGRDYFIRVEDCHNHASRPEMLTVYHRGFDGLKKTKVLINFKDSSDKVLISEDPLRVYFKASSLEEIES